jgi:hypothetical protein
VAEEYIHYPHDFPQSFVAHRKSQTEIQCLICDVSKGLLNLNLISTLFGLSRMEQDEENKALRA